MLSEIDEQFLEIAVAEARLGKEEGGVPIGAALVVNNKVLGRGRNRRMQESSAIKHGEMDALENAGPLNAAIYRQATMYTTLSPCDMCSGAMLLYEIPRVVVAENETYRGPEDFLRSRGIEVINADSEECKGLMREFITKHPDIWNQDIGET